MREGEASTDAAGRGAAVARARVDDLRRLLTVTTDEATRSRLRVRLVDLLSALGDPGPALGEVRQAAAEGLPSAGLLFAMRLAAPHLSPDEVEILRSAIRARRPAAPARSGTGRGRSSAHPTVRLPNVSSAPVLPAAPTPAPFPERGQEAVPPIGVLEQAFAALAEGKPSRARRLGEEAARAGAPSGDDPGARRLAELVDSLEKAGARRESLLLARALAEGGPPAAAGTEAPSMPQQRQQVRALVDRAARLGDADLAARWRVDLAEAPRARRASSVTSATGAAGRFQAAQRAALTEDGEGTGPDAAISQLLPLLGGHPGGEAALKLAERMATAAAAQGKPAPARAELLRLAFGAENDPRRRVKLALAWADALALADDATGATVVLSRAIDGIPAEMSLPLRRARAVLLRAGGREGELARALDVDASLATGAARLELRAEQARLLDRLGDFDHALEVRLATLAEAPGELGVLAPARQRFEGLGRLDRSMELASAAIPHVKDRLARISLLRDVATMAEAAMGDRERAVVAWLELLSLYPDDGGAFEAAERLLRQLGDRDRLGTLLAWSAAREAEPAARAQALWRLAEFRRVQRAEPLGALPLYREIIGLRVSEGGSALGLEFKDQDWQRRDDLLAVHTARVLAAPTPAAAASALAERAELLIAAHRLDEADRELGRALDVEPADIDVLAALQRLHERRGDLSGLRKRLNTRMERVAPGETTAPLWLGIGLANAALGDLAGARAAYERALAGDARFGPALTRLRQMAAARADWAEVARLLERELNLSVTTSERLELSIELALVLTDKVGSDGSAGSDGSDGSERAARAVEVLEAALVLEPAHAGALDALFNAALSAGLWEKGMQALEALLASGLALADTSQRYYRLGLVAEAAGQIDRALGFYSRSYARNPVFRPTLERLSEICFERQQWENAWKATEHLLERHGADLEGAVRAELALRSALADLHVAQRLVAANRVAAMLSGPVSQAGLRDIAESWASMRFERRLLTGVDGDRRARVLVRLAEVLTLTRSTPGSVARSVAHETLAALAVVERRWADALALLDALGGDPALDARRRCLFLLAAGDILLHQQRDDAGAALRFQRARVLNPAEVRLTRPSVGHLGHLGQVAVAVGGVLNGDADAAMAQTPAPGHPPARRDQQPDRMDERGEDVGDGRRGDGHAAAPPAKTGPPRRR